MNDFDNWKKSLVAERNQAMKFHRKEMLRKQKIVHQRMLSVQNNKEKEVLKEFVSHQE